MKRMIITIAMLVILAACAGPDKQTSLVQPTTIQKENLALASVQPTEEGSVVILAPTPTFLPAKINPTVAPIVNPAGKTSTYLLSQETVPEAIGPDNFPPGINPLTGMPVKDRTLLALPPALVSVSNFPVTARPQAGLSFCPYVFEMYVGEGMTRFLAMFYGDYPTVQTETDASNSQTPSDRAGIGPIRSGRLPYESLRKLYNGFLVMASASPEVGAQLKNSTNVYNPTDNDINGAMVDVTRLEAYAHASAEIKNKINLTGNAFNQSTPKDGSPANTLQIFYNYLNQVKWTYDAASGSYLRFQDKADGSGNFFPAEDHLTGKQLAFNNVILLYARHKVLNRAGTLIDIDLLYTSGKAYLFRDGQIYPIKWTTVNGDYEKTSGQLRPIRFTTENNDPVWLKPGNTWVEVVDVSTLTQNPQSGIWKARFFNP
jgi:hypothetical protein